MASIVQNLLGDKAIQLGSEEFARKLVFGNQWKFLKIGMLLRIFGNTYVGGSATLPTNLVFGLNDGDQNTYTSNNCAGFIGITPGTNTGGSSSKFAYNYDAVNRRYVCPPSNSYLLMNVSKSLSSLSYTGYVTFGQAYYAASTSDGPGVVVVAFIRTGTTSVQPYYYYQTAAQFAATNPVTEGNLLRIMEEEGIGAYGSSFLTSVTNGNMTSQPSNLDTFCVYWSRNVPMVEISALCAVRYY